MVNGSPGTSVAANTTVYFALANTVASAQSNTVLAQITYRTAGTLSNLFVLVESNANTGNSVFRVRRNGAAGSAAASDANGNQFVTVASGLTGQFEDTTYTDTVVAGDEYNYSLVTGATGGALVFDIISILFAATTDTMVRHAAVEGIWVPSESDLIYQWAVCDLLSSLSAVVMDAGIKTYTLGTAKNLFTYVSDNSCGSNVVIAFAVQDTATTLKVTIGAGTTGVFENTTVTKPINSGDFIEYLMTLPNEAGLDRGITVDIISVENVTTNNSFNSAYGECISSQVFNSTRYIPIGGAGIFETTEANTKTDINIGSQVSKLVIYVISNSISG